MRNSFELIDSFNTNLAQAESVLMLLFVNFSENDGDFSLNPHIIENAITNIQSLILNAKQDGNELGELLMNTEKQGGKDE
ncbi:hypothetical protein [Lonepinella sp. MS14437]|uniref:hypothetical protein n=1 Tax=Lonepinella sp. MS14437 TaxID=3003620 RepID=UPI0036D76A71